MVVRKTVEDLTVKLTDLCKRRVELALQLKGASDRDGLAELVLVQAAIEAIEKAIATENVRPEVDILKKFKAMT